MSSATCCMTTLVSFPSGHIKFECILLLTDQRCLRTINDDRDLVVDGLYIVINAGHSLVDTGYPVVDASYSIVDIIRGLQNLGSYHPDFFICQLVQPPQRIFYVGLSNQLLQVFF